MEYPIIANHVIYPSDKTTNAKWRTIMIDGVETIYEMNIKGWLRNKRTGYYPKQVISDQGYYKIELRFYNNESEYGTKRPNHSMFFKHRLLCCLFLPIPKKYKELGYKQENLCINHIDGDKLNCDIKNLEWCTPSENQAHAIKMGLKKSCGEDRLPNEKVYQISEATIRKALMLLEQGKTVHETAKLTGISASYIYHLVNGKYWKRTVRDYDQNKMRQTFRKQPHLTDKDMHEICYLLAETEISVKDIADKFGVSPTYIYMINNGEKIIRISSQYNLPRQSIVDNSNKEKRRHKVV